MKRLADTSAVGLFSLSGRFSGRFSANGSCSVHACLFKAGPLPEWPEGIRACMLHDPTAMDSCKAHGCIISGEYGGTCTVLLNNVCAVSTHTRTCVVMWGWGGVSLMWG